MPRHQNRFEVRSYLEGVIGSADSLSMARQIGEAYIRRSDLPAYIQERGENVNRVRLANYGAGWITRSEHDHILAHAER